MYLVTSSVREIVYKDLDKCREKRIHVHQQGKP